MKKAELKVGEAYAITEARCKPRAWDYVGDSKKEIAERKRGTRTDSGWRTVFRGVLLELDGERTVSTVRFGVREDIKKRGIVFKIEERFDDSRGNGSREIVVPDTRCVHTTWEEWLRLCEEKTEAAQERREEEQRVEALGRKVKRTLKEVGVTKFDSWSDDVITFDTEEGLKQLLTLAKFGVDGMLDASAESKVSA